MVVVVVVAAPTHENLCMYTTVELLSDICALTVKRKLRQEKHTHTQTTAMATATATATATTTATECVDTDAANVRF